VFNFAEEAGHGNAPSTVTLDNPESTLSKSELLDKKEPKEIKENVSGTQDSFVPPDKKDEETPSISDTIDSLKKQTGNQEKINKKNSSLQKDADKDMNRNEYTRQHRLENSNFLVNKTASGNNLWR
jgi:hypothetical protein